MKKDFGKRSELIGLEEINQVEKEEVNGGYLSNVLYPDAPGPIGYPELGYPRPGYPGPIIIIIRI